jgi:hypothetical protein
VSLKIIHTIPLTMNTLKSSYTPIDSFIDEERKAIIESSNKLFSSPLLLSAAVASHLRALQLKKSLQRKLHSLDVLEKEKRIFQLKLRAILSWYKPEAAVYLKSFYEFGVVQLTGIPRPRGFFKWPRSRKFLGNSSNSSISREDSDSPQLTYFRTLDPDRVRTPVIYAESSSSFAPSVFIL